MNDTSIVDLRCEYLTQPLGIDVLTPRLSWRMSSQRRGARQKAYRICVASYPEWVNSDSGNLWDSGWVNENISNHILYAGVALQSRQKCYWFVEVQEETGTICRSSLSLWTMGLLDKLDWVAQWIASNPDLSLRDTNINVSTLDNPGAVGYFRREFAANYEIASATLYATARGVFEVNINGQRVGDDLFAPEWTDYDNRIQYRTYDVTEQLNIGDNCIAAILGDGWWSGYVGWQEQRGRYGSLENSLLLQLEIEFVDGRHLTLGSDRSWLCNSGPILFSDFMLGETYDARLELPAWDKPNLTETGRWLPVKEVPEPTALLVAQCSEPIQIIQTITPVSMNEHSSGGIIYDLGQNISGWVKISLPELTPGTEVVIRHGEMLEPDGSLHRSNLRRAKATDTYISAGKAVVWQPHFTFHGFQYIEVIGLPTWFKADLTTVTGCVIHSATAQTGHFECSHSGVNRLWLNALWSQKDNFISVPTDCPQRDERLGWTGDAQVFLRTATCNMDVAAFFTKWMVDIADGQTPEGVFPDTAPRLREDINFVGLGELGGGAGWADAGIIIPYTLWRLYGDRRILQHHYKAMVRWIDWIEQHNPDGLRVNQLANNYGDWLCIPSDTSFGTHSPMKNLLATAFWADDCAKLSRIAGELGLLDDEQRFSNLFAKIRQAFQAQWLLEGGRLSVDTQTAYLLALAFDLLPNDVRQQSAEYLVENIRNQDWHLNTGFIGVGLLNPQLTQAGFANVAYKLLLQDTYPAWLYPVMHGATTIWERWDGWTEKDGFFDPHMNSFNHYSLGSVSEWLYRHVAGIELESEVAGSQHFILCPFIEEGLDYAQAKLGTMHGEIFSHWQKVDDGLKWQICIPPNTEALVRVPSYSPENIIVDGQPILSVLNSASIVIEEARCCFLLPAGEYEIGIFQ